MVENSAIALGLFSPMAVAGSYAAERSNALENPSTGVGE
jgi:hypothetical protein